MLAEIILRLAGQVTSHRVVYLSGLPACGKTTVIRLLASELDAIVVPEFMDSIPEWIINLRPGASAEEHLAAQRWVVDQHVAKNDFVLRKRECGRLILVDRTFVDAVIYAAAYSADIRAAITVKVAGHHWAPGLFIALVARPDVIKERMITRGDSEGDGWERNWRSFVEILQQGYEDLIAVHAVVGIDTTMLTTAESAEQVCHHVMRHWPGFGDKKA